MQQNNLILSTKMLNSFSSYVDEIKKITLDEWYNNINNT